jgi:hypothetical protein
MIFSPTGRADHFVAVHEWRLTKIQHRTRPLKSALRSVSKRFASVAWRQTVCPRAPSHKAGPHPPSEWHSDLLLIAANSAAEPARFGPPRFPCRPSRRAPKRSRRSAMAHSVDAARGNGRRAVATAKPFDLPGERRAVLRPFLEQPGLFGMGRAVRSLPLRPNQSCLALKSRVARKSVSAEDTGYFANSFLNSYLDKFGFPRSRLITADSSNTDLVMPRQAPLQTSNSNSRHSIAPDVALTAQATPESR